MKLKLYGLPRSGTNFVELLLRENLDATILTNDNSGSKHSLACYRYTRTGPDRVVIVSKNIWAWLTSIYRWAQKHPKGRYVYSKPFGAFLRHEFAYPDSGSKLYFGNPIRAWNQMHRHWLGLAKTRVLQHEDLLSRGACESGLRELAKWAKVKCAKSFSCRPARIDPSMKITAARMDTAYYLKRRYMKQFGPKDRRHIIGSLDKVVCKGLGYPCE